MERHQKTADEVGMPQELYDYKLCPWYPVASLLINDDSRRVVVEQVRKVYPETARWADSHWTEALLQVFKHLHQWERHFMFVVDMSTAQSFAITTLLYYGYEEREKVVPMPLPKFNDDFYKNLWHNF